MRKMRLYEIFIQRQRSSFENGYYFESAWFTYSILEDRAVSMLRQSGEIGNLRMLGPKIAELKTRLPNDAYLRGATLDGLIIDEMYTWKERRNILMYRMAEGTISIEDIDKEIFLIANVGIKLIVTVQPTLRGY